MENTTLINMKAVITKNIPNGVLVTYANGHVDECVDDPEMEPFFSNLEIGQEVIWGLFV